MSLNDEIKKGKSKVYRRAYIKRRLATTGLFEDTWFEVTDDVKKWGSIVQKIDQERQGRIRFSATNITMANDTGRYNPETNENSLWFGYASQQRTLFRIDAGFIDQTQTSDGIWTNVEYPNSEWDNALYGQHVWDGDGTVFVGTLQGNLNIDTKNDMKYSVKPLTQILRDFPAEQLTGFTSTGLTASQFVEAVRDQTDGAGLYIFRPFFGDTTTNWNIQTTTVEYAELNTSTSAQVVGKSVWDIIEKLSEAESYLSYIDNSGQFNFIANGNISSSTTFNFNGPGGNDRTYGTQLKGISFFGFRHSKYYSRVQVKHNELSTATSYHTVEASFAVNAGSSAWNFGHKTFSFNNFWLSATSAETVAQQVFDNISSAKNEIEFTSSFVPSLNITDRLSITYDSNPVSADSLWDSNNWGDTVTASGDLEWDNNLGNAIYILNDEYKPLSVKLDLDKLETSIVAREI